MRTLAGLVQTANIYASESTHFVYMDLDFQNLIVAFNCDLPTAQSLKTNPVDSDAFEIRAGGNVLEAFMPYDYHFTL